MTALRLVITDAGQARFTEAQLAGGIELAVASIGLTAQDFVAAPTLTALPGEFRRVTTLSGEAVGDNTVHLVVRDDEAVAYAVRGFALYLADGTPFAVYGQPAPIFQKAAATSMLLVLDVAFPTADIDQLVFGDTNFLNPPATSERRGVVELATLAEAQAGTDPARVASILILRQLLDALFGTVDEDIVAVLARTITGGGLVTGGGPLSGNPVLTVTPATAAEAVAGQLADRAMTPASTKAAIDAAIAALVNGAPGALDQLNELATALGNDPAFATTMINALALRLQAASAAEVRAGQVADRGVTPATLWSFPRTVAEHEGSVQIPGTPMIVKWFRVAIGANSGVDAPLAEAFPNACVFAACSGGTNGTDAQDNNPVVTAFSAATISLYSARDEARTVFVFALGF